MASVGVSRLPRKDANEGRGSAGLKLSFEGVDVSVSNDGVQGVEGKHLASKLQEKMRRVPTPDCEAMSTDVGDGMQP